MFLFREMLASTEAESTQRNKCSQLNAFKQLLATKMDQSLLPSTVNLQEFPDNKLDLYLGNFLSNLKHSSTYWRRTRYYNYYISKMYL